MVEVRGGDAGRAGVAALTCEEQAALRQSIDQVAREVDRHLRSGERHVHVIQWVRHLQQNVDAVYAQRIASDGPVMCRKGCGHCCHVEVRALPAEVFLIARHLRRLHEDGSPLLSRLLERLVQHGQDVQAHQAGQGSQPVCPFLSEQVCTIYSARPSVCRKGHSLDAQACEQHAEHIPQHLRLVADAEALIMGAVQGYAMQGLSSTAVELVSGVHLALTSPDSEDRWLAGEDVFDQPARTG